MEKAKYMAFEVKIMGSYNRVGHANMSVRLLLLETIVKPTLLANTETWCNISDREEKLITTHHHEILCIVFGQPKNTPYYGILGETGIWPYTYVILYKKLMYLHHLIHSNDERICKTIVTKQQQIMEYDKETWYAELQNRVHTMNINTDIRSLKNKLKSTWKQEIKTKLQKAIEKDFIEQTSQKTKLRFQRGKSFEREGYVEQCGAETCQEIMKIRLNMVECKMNFKNANIDTKCIMCNNDETTEHLLECSYYKQFTGENLEPVDNNRIKSVDWLKKAVKVMGTIQEIRQQSIVTSPAPKGSKH